MKLSKLVRSSSFMVLTAGVLIGLVIAGIALWRSPWEEEDARQPASESPPTSSARRPRSTTTTSNSPASSDIAPDTSVAAAPELEDTCPTGETFTCVATDSGDVDGDGSQDAVGVYVQDVAINDSPTIYVRVLYGDGTEETFSDPNGVNAGLLGVTDLDGDGREEIAVLHDPGAAHTRWGTFLGTSSTGRLHPVGLGVGQVVLDSSASEVVGFSCPDDDGDGVRDFVVVSAWHDPVMGTEGTTTTYRWVDDRLEEVDQESEVITEDVNSDGTLDMAGEYFNQGGAHCGDLQPFGV